MDKSDDVATLLTEIRDHLRDGAKRQAELLEFHRGQAERTQALVDRSVALQELAIRRQKSVIVFVLPIIVVCLAVLAWLIFGTRWR